MIKIIEKLIKNTTKNIKKLTGEIIIEKRENIEKSIKIIEDLIEDSKVNFQNKLIIFIYILSILFQFIFFKDINHSIGLFIGLIFVFSIFLVSYIISLSVLARSKFVGKLYLDEVRDTRGLVTTHMHILIKIYEFSLKLSSISIFYLLFMIFTFYPYESPSLFYEICSYLIIPLTIHNFTCFSRLSYILIRVVIQDLKRPHEWTHIKNKHEKSN